MNLLAAFKTRSIRERNSSRQLPFCALAALIVLVALGALRLNDRLGELNLMSVRRDLPEGSEYATAYRFRWIAGGSIVVAVVGVVTYGVWIDSTLSRLRSELQQTRHRLSAFRDAANVAGIVAVADREGTAIQINDNLCAMSGYSRDELLGTGRHSSSFFEETYSKIKDGGSWHGEICNRAKDGSPYWVDTTIVPILEDSGKHRGYLALGINITERKRMLDQLQELALHDGLTGLPNRVSILSSIQSAIDRRDGTHYALLFLDFDRFKLINDSLGHEVGDQFLQAIAERLRETFRPQNAVAESRSRATPARLGGDEFVVLLEGLTVQKDAVAVAERLRNVLSERYELSRHEVFSAASIGVVTSEERYVSADEMLRDADLAMYEAKATGKGRYVVFDQTMRTKVQTRLRIENDLRAAISAEEFVLAYQPIVSLETGRTEGFEALVRWPHPERGMISPEDFIPVAEETGLIVPIGMWVLDEACRQFADWQRSFGLESPSSIHVNLSRRQLVHHNLGKVVRRVIETHGIPPHCLHLEVTEREIMYDTKTAISTLSELKQLGLKVDMDDFGTGHSSLYCLHEFPLDVLKVDRAFVANVRRGRDFAALLHAVVTLADNLGLKVVAEGIEDADQITLLQALGCEFGQGYFLAKPMTSDEVKNWLVSMGTTGVNELSSIDGSDGPSSESVNRLRKTEI